jgi:Tfp pilus assembly protein PilO
MKQNRLLALVVVPLLFGIGLLGLKARQVINYTRQVAKKRAKIEKKTEVINNYQQQLEQVDEFNFKQGSITAFLTQIQEISSKLDVRLKKIRPQTKEREADFSRQLIELSLQGDYQSLVQFLSKLQAAGWIIKAESIIVTSLTDSLEAEVKLSLYNVWQGGEQE